MSKKILSVIVAVVVIVLGGLGSVPVSAKAVTLNKNSLTLTVKGKATLKLNGVKASRVQWESSDKKVITVSSKGTVKAKKAGKAVVYAYYSGKAYSCDVTVSKAAETKVETKAEPKVEPRTSNHATSYADVAFDDTWAVLFTACGNYSSYAATREGTNCTYNLGLETVFITENIEETQSLYEAGKAEAYIQELATSYKNAASVHVAASIAAGADYALYKSTVKAFDGKYTVYYTTMVGNIQINATLTADDGSEPTEDVELSVEKSIREAYACAKSWATLDTVD